MPISLSAIPSFEKRNRCSINVYQMENSKLVSLYHSKNRRGRHKNDLLRLMDNQNSHYCLIKKFSNLIHFLTGSRMKHDKGPNSRFCRNSFQPIVTKNFKKHVSFCESNAPLEIRTPLESPKIEFVNWEKTQSVPLMFMLTLKQSMWLQHNFLKLNVGQENFKSSMQPVLEQSWLILEVS